MFTLPQLIVRNLRFHWRGNLAVLLGVAVGSAVLTGALLVGDSLRGSLRAQVERQLAGVDAVAMFPRLLRAEIANGLPGNTAPVLLLSGSVQSIKANETTAPFLSGVTVLGVDERFASFGIPASVLDWNSDDRRIVLSARVAEALGVGIGDRVRLGVERFSDLPRSSGLSKRATADVTATAEFQVAGVLPADAPGNDFKLTPNPAAPHNVFVPLKALYELVRPLNLNGRPLPDDVLSINALVSSGVGVDELSAALRQRLNARDYGIKFIEVREYYLSVEYDQLVFPPATADAVLAAAKELGRPAEPTVVYIADTLSFEAKEIPYPVIAGLRLDGSPPLGGFLPEGITFLADSEVVLLDWDGSELNNLLDGTELKLTYYDPEVEGEGIIRTAKLKLRTPYLHLPRSRAERDRFRFLTPQIRGVTDVRTRLEDIDLPPVLPKKQTDKRLPPGHPRRRFIDSLDKATPIAYVNLATAERLFSSRYGSVTSIRVAPATGESPDLLHDRLEPVLLRHLDPLTAGLTFDPVRERLLAASRGGTDFGGLFLGFSFFLIAAALMLVGLLFRLSLDRRAKEVGLLLAAGYPVRTVRRLILTEGLALAVFGSLAGLVLGVGYNRLLLIVLLELWPDREVANLLRPHTSALSFTVGFVLTLAMAFGALWVSVRGLVKVPPPALLRGETQLATTDPHRPTQFSWWLMITGLTLGIALVVLGQFVTNPDYQAMTFFAGGGLLLATGLIALRGWLKRNRHTSIAGRGFAALVRLGGRNAARNPTRSLLTAGLLAAAAFLLVAVESFRRQTGTEFFDKHGGSGGFNLIAEGDVPLFQPFDTGPGRAELNARLREVGADPTSLDGIEVFALRLRGGDDASCMNLFQATRPRVLGVPASLINRGGFKFYATEAVTAEEKANPWQLLSKSTPDDTIPVFCEQNTAQWMLKKAIGDEITLPGDDGRELRLRIVGTLIDSPFQSELLMADDRFVRAFPNTAGYRVFLVRTDSRNEATVARLLGIGLRSNGLMVTSTRDRVATYQAVIGAYLSTFQLLGGLGLLLGVLGLAAVVLRGVWERIGELALLRAVGYRTQQLQFLVLAENALLLLVGLGIGVAAAIVSVAPHVVAGATVPWLRLAGILTLVLAVGLGVASTATAGILRVPLISALRRE